MASVRTVVTHRGRKKARKDCGICKRRHVDCDKALPACQNCITYGLDCDFAHSANRIAQKNARVVRLNSDSSSEAVTVVSDITIGFVDDGGSRTASDGSNRALTAIAPPKSPSSYAMPPNQHKLLYHMSAIASSIEIGQSSNLVIYLKRLPSFLTISFTYDFVMHSLMAWAASHLAFSTDSRDAHNVARHYRGLSMQGLQHAISTFNEKNADAVLSASLLLSWQAQSPLEWATLNKGTSAVIAAIQPFRKTSLFAGYIEEDAMYKISPNVVKFPVNFLTDTDEAAALRYIHDALSRVEQYAEGHHIETRLIHDLMAFVNNVERHLPITEPAMRFYLLEPTRSMLFWYPAQLFQAAEKNPVTMVVLAHLYAISLTVQPVFAGPGAAHFRGLSAVPIEDLYQRLMDMHRANGQKLDSFKPLSLMHFPMQSVNLFRSRMGLSQNVLQADQSLTAIQYGLDPLTDMPSSMDLVGE